MHTPRFCARPVLFLLCLLPGLLLGCQKAVPVVTFPAADAGAPRQAGIRSVQQAPEYQEAERLFSRKDYRGALAAVDALLASPAYRGSPADQAFLQRQRDICRNAVAGRPLQPAAPAAAAATSATAPQPSTARSHQRSSSSASSDSSDCGPRALLLVCRQMRVPSVSLAELRTAAGTTGEGTTLAGLAKAAKVVGLKAQGVQMDKNALAHLSRPALAWVEGSHYIAVLSIDSRKETATIRDPNSEGKEEVIPLRRLLSRSGGILLTLSPLPGAMGQAAAAAAGGRRSG